MDLPKATVYRLLYTMQQRNVVEKEPDSDLYRLGIKLIEYGEKVRYDLNLVDFAKPLMKFTAQSTGESINIGIRHENKIVTLHSEKGESSVLVSRLIPVADLYCSSLEMLLRPLVCLVQHLV
jgi:IclR family KDG regulon transcriptional repressor